MSNPINDRFIASPQGKKISIYVYLCFFGNMLRLFMKHALVPEEGDRVVGMMKRIYRGKKKKTFFLKKF
ncbi:hypothetical protein UP17_22330 [Peribacillus simplex]|jgi:hypothetical protein|nr:hypothetical protein UP17_22330 [Peribacillus simplex]